MNKTCLCCGSPITKQVCDYCGFVDVEVIASGVDEFLKQEIADYKAELLQKLTDISVVAYSYKWNDEKSRLEMKKKQDLRLANGADCYPRVKMVNQEFGQVTPGQDLTLTLSYKFDGSKKSLVCTIPTVQCDNFWKIGLQINEQLRLQVFLGTPKNHTQSQPLSLDFH